MGEKSKTNVGECDVTEKLMFCARIDNSTAVTDVAAECVGDRVWANSHRHLNLSLSGYATVCLP